MTAIRLKRTLLCAAGSMKLPVKDLPRVWTAEIHGLNLMTGSVITLTWWMLQLIPVMQIRGLLLLRKDRIRHIFRNAQIPGWYAGPAAVLGSLLRPDCLRLKVHQCLRY